MARKFRNLTNGLISGLLAVALILAVLACNQGPLPTPPPPPPPSSVPESTPPASASALVPSAVPSSTPKSVDFNPTISSDKALVSFPDKISFSLAGISTVNVKDIRLNVVTGRRSLAPEVDTEKPDFNPGRNLAAKYDWEFKKTGSIPPGTSFWWHWELTDDGGRKFLTPQQTLTYSDTRFTWSVRHLTNLDIYWHDQSESLINTLLSQVDSKLSVIKLDVSIPPERKPQVYVYRSSQEVKTAVLFSQQWTGALAFPGYNIILTALDSSILSWAEEALPHEITHLLVGEAVFGPFGQLPTWLNEGLASYAQGDMSPNALQALNDAVKNNQLISLRSLGGTFPADEIQTRLAYAESQSLVTYLINHGGWDKMCLLLSTFKDGATLDNAILKAYSLDGSGLESAWRLSLGAKP